MKKLMIAVMVMAVLGVVMAQDGTEPKELIQARTSYIKTLEGLKAKIKAQSSIDALQAEIDKVKVEVAEVQAPAAPDKPGVKVTKLTEFPDMVNLTAADWDKLHGKIIKVNALYDNIGSKADYDKSFMNIKANESFYAVPHPTEKWNISKKIAVTWAGTEDERRAGRMAMDMINPTSPNRMVKVRIEQAIEGPLRIRFNSGVQYQDLPPILYSGSIRVKLVPAE